MREAWEGEDYTNCEDGENRMNERLSSGHRGNRGDMVKLYLRMGFLVMLVLVLVCVTGCVKKAPEAVSMNNYFLDTICKISVYEMKEAESGEVRKATDCPAEAEEAMTEAFALCAELDKTLSRTAEASDVFKVNHANGEWVEVSDETIELVRRACDWSIVSGGDFDISIGGVTELWDFHVDPGEGKLPEEDSLEEAVSHVDYNNIEIDGNMLRLTDPDAKLDLGGIAKGYIGDRMAETLEEAGVTSGIINLGGNVICIGAKDNSADEEGWFRIGVEAPFSDRRQIVGSIPAKNMTLVTSGIYERQIEVDGKLYHHILNPNTGYPAESDLVAVTLIGPRGTSADLDALSTICLIKGYEGSKGLLDQINADLSDEVKIEAVYIFQDDRVVASDGADLNQEE